MKAPKAKAKSTTKKIFKRPAAALPDPEPKANAKAKAKTVKEMAEDGRRRPGMNQFLMKRRSLKRMMQQLLMISIEATPMRGSGPE